MLIPKKLMAILCVAFSFNALSQDVIYLQSDSLIVHIEEIGQNEIKYRSLDSSSTFLTVVDIKKVKKLKLANGKSIVFYKSSGEYQYAAADYYLDQNKNALKFSITSIINRHMDFYYERSINPKSTYEICLGIAGLGFKAEEGYHNSEDSLWHNLDANYGVSLRLGYKLKMSTDFQVNRLRYAHLLKGAYVKPELMLSYFNLLTEYRSQSHIPPAPSNTDVFSGAFMINLGKQWVFTDKFLLDLYFGFGYGITSDSGNSTSQYAFILIPDTPLAITGGLSFGYIF